MKKKATFKDLIMLELVFLIYSCSSLVGKFSAGSEVMSFKFILFYGLEVGILGVYAIIWQQVIKKFELSVAYANKAVTLLWALLWSVILFGETLKLNQVIGILLVIVGIVFLNTDGKAKDVEAKEEA